MTESNDPKIPVPKSKNAVYRDELSTLIGLAACLGGTRLPKSEKNTPKPKSEKNTPKPAQERVGEFVMAPTSAGVSTAKGDLEHKYVRVHILRGWCKGGTGLRLTCACACGPGSCRGWWTATALCWRDWCSPPHSSGARGVGACFVPPSRAVTFTSTCLVVHRGCGRL